ncbi:hypothetical protein ACTXT7_008277 [Hymenolepis weldensis]
MFKRWIHFESFPRSPEASGVTIELRWVYGVSGFKGGDHIQDEGADCCFGTVSLETRRPGTILGVKGSIHYL